MGSPCHLGFNTTPTFLRPEIADVIARAPDKFVLLFGVQSTNPRALQTIDRVFDRDAVERNILYLKERAPRAQFALQIIFGLPGDDWEGFRMSLDWALRLEPRWLELGSLLVLPGSAVAREAQELGIVHAERPPYQVIRTPTMSPEDVNRAFELTCIVGSFFTFRTCGRRSLRPAPSICLSLRGGWSP